MRNSLHKVLLLLAAVHLSLQHDGPHGIGSDIAVGGIPVDPAMDPSFDKAPIAIVAADPGFPAKPAIVGRDDGVMVDPGFSISGGPSPIGIVDMKTAAPTRGRGHGYDPYLEGNNGFVSTRDDRGFLANTGGHSGFIDDGLGVSGTDPVGLPGGGILLPGGGVLVPPGPEALIPPRDDVVLPRRDDVLLPPVSVRDTRGLAGSRRFGLGSDVGINIDDRRFGDFTDNRFRKNRRDDLGTLVDGQFLDFGERRNFDNGINFGNGVVGQQGVAGSPVITPASVAGVEFIGRRASNRMMTRNIGALAARSRGFTDRHDFRSMPLILTPEPNSVYRNGGHGVIDRPYNGPKLRGFRNIIDDGFGRPRMHSSGQVGQIGFAGLAAQDRYVNIGPSGYPQSPVRPTMKPIRPPLMPRKPMPIQQRTKRPYYQSNIHRATPAIAIHSLKRPMTGARHIYDRNHRIYTGTAGVGGFYQRYPQSGYGYKGDWGRQRYYYKPRDQRRYYH